MRCKRTYTYERQTVMSDTSQHAEYLRRSYTAVDGLWFVLLEEKLGFDAAMEFDHAVWRIMPKIQARKAAELCGVPRDGLDALKKTLQLKFEAEQYEYAASDGPGDQLTFEFTRCPWWDLLVKADRAHLGKIIAERICGPEFNVWAEQFGCKHVGPACPQGLCTGHGACRITFATGSATM